MEFGHYFKNVLWKKISAKYVGCWEFFATQKFHYIFLQNLDSQTLKQTFSLQT